MRNWLDSCREAFRAPPNQDPIAPDRNESREAWWKMLRCILPSVLRFRRLGLLLLVFLLLNALLQLPAPMITRYLIDHVMLDKRMDLLLPVVLVLVAVSGGSMLARLLQQFYGNRYTQEVTVDIQNRLIERVLALPKAFFDRTQKGYLMSRITGDVGSLNFFFSGAVAQVFVQAVKLLGGIGFLFYLEWRIAVPVTISLLLPCLVTVLFSRRQYVLSHRSREQYASCHSTIQELLSTAPLIKAFAAEKEAGKEIDGKLREQCLIQNQNMVLGSLNNMAMNLMPGAAKLCVLGFGAYWVIRGEWSIGSLLAYQVYLGFVYGPVTMLASTVTQLQSSRAGLERVDALFRMTPEANVDGGEKVDHIEGEIEFRQISFSYGKEKPVLHDLSFRIRPGEHVAVIGPSGIGKSTLIHLIMRFYVPNAGDILIDGRPAADYNIRSLRRRIGLVAQKTELLTGSIADNIRYGSEDATTADIHRAATAAGIHSFVMSLPDGYESRLDEAGANLSEGQKQRLAIARALVRNPDILIFDEPTASLDDPTERSVCQAILPFLSGKTCIIIAHRHATIANADRILFLTDDGLLDGSTDSLSQHPEFRSFFHDTRSRSARLDPKHNIGKCRECGQAETVELVANI